MTATRGRPPRTAPDALDRAILDAVDSCAAIGLTLGASHLTTVVRSAGHEVSPATVTRRLHAMADAGSVERVGKARGGGGWRRLR